MKSYYSCIDSGYVRYAPQPLQHLANTDKARRAGGRVIFYTAEDFESLASQGIIRAKIEQEDGQFDGVIFFTLKQFFYGGEFNFSFLKSILDQGYEVHFARENLSLPDGEALEAAFPLLYASQFVEQRDEPRQFWQPVWDWSHGE